MEEGYLVFALSKLMCFLLFPIFFYTSECGSRGFNRCFINVIVSCFTSICFILITRFLFFRLHPYGQRGADGKCYPCTIFFFFFYISSKKDYFCECPCVNITFFKPPFLYLMNFLLQFYLLTDRHRQRWWWLRGIRLWIGMIGDGYP